LKTSSPDETSAFENLGDENLLFHLDLFEDQNVKSLPKGMMPSRRLYTGTFWILTPMTFSKRLEVR